MIERVDINNVLQQMRQLKARAQNNPSNPFAVGGVSDSAQSARRDLTIRADNGAPNFGDMLTKAINNVNSIQKESGDLSRAYEMGDPKVDITRVMVASQKASVSFQGMVQVRNKLIGAYEDVMNMPI